MPKRPEPLGWFFVDLGAFLISRSLHVARRVAARLRRRRRMARLLRELREVAGALVCIRPIVAPLSQRRVAACRLVVERVDEEGSWTVIFDETQLGELEVSCRGVRAVLEAPALLVRPQGTPFDGRAVRAALGREIPAEEEELRATEYLAHHGELVHVFGLESTSLGNSNRPEGPYRTAPPALARRSASSAVVISTWSRAELMREIVERPHLVPPV